MIIVKIGPRSLTVRITREGERKITEKHFLSPFLLLILPLLFPLHPFVPSILSLFLHLSLNLGRNGKGCCVQMRHFRRLFFGRSASRHRRLFGKSSHLGSRKNPRAHISRKGDDCVTRIKLCNTPHHMSWITLLSNQTTLVG